MTVDVKNRLEQAILSETMSEPAPRSQETVQGGILHESLDASHECEQEAVHQHESTFPSYKRSTVRNKSKSAETHVRMHPKKLYGRSKEVSTLLQAYRKMKEDQGGNIRPPVVVISGADGTGKTVLAQSLRKPVTDDGGYFIRGNFCQLSSRGEPYTAFIAAFKELTNLVVSRGIEERNAMRNDIQTAVPEDSRILIDTIPSLEAIIALQEEEAHSDDSPARIRFAFVFRKFMRAVCSPRRPLVILLDDVQFADQSSLDLFSALILDASNQGIMFVVTCKDSQPQSPLSTLLGRLEDSRVVITRLRLSNLHDETVNSIVADILELPAPQTKHLSDFIFNETAGNVYFVLEFFCSLRDNGLLKFDEESVRWVVDEQGIYEEMRSYNVGELILDRMTRQPQSLLEVLKVASCLNSTLDVLILDRVFETSISRHLLQGSECGFFVYDTQLEAYSFAHDAVQNAAYSLIPRDQTHVFHLSIGRKLRRNLSEDEFDRNIFVVMNQFQLGADCIQSQEEKYAVAELCLRSAERAVAASSFPTASLYLELGIWLLEVDAWKDQYALCLALYNTAAEVNYCTGDFDRVNTLLTAVFDNARCFNGKLRAYCIQAYALGATEKMEEAINLGLDVLGQLGEKIPAYPTAWRVTREMRKLKRVTDAMTNETLLRLPLMRDPRKLASVKLMGLIFLYAHLCRPQLAGFLVLRMMQDTLHGGLSAMSSSAFVLYGMLLCSLAEDRDEGYRFGSLALVLLDKFKANAKNWLPRVYAGQYGCISPWKRPFRLSLEPLKRSVMIGLEFGDIEYSMLNANLYCFILMDAGRPLPFIESEVQSFCEIMTLQKQEGTLAMVRPFTQLIQNLTGQRHDLVSETGQLRFDQTSLPIQGDKAKNVLNSFAIHLHGTVLAYLFGDYGLALHLIDNCLPVLQHPLANYNKCTVVNWASLVSLALAATSVGKKKATHVARSRRYMKMLEKWALESPHNYVADLSLLEAEHASTKGDRKRAYAKYLIAISVAKEEGLLNAECMANERAGRHLLRLNDFVNAAPFLQRSYCLYLEWGAKVKAEQLKNEFSHCITG